MSGQGTSSHKSSSVFNDLLLEGHFCDAVIKVGDVEFPIHKIILCNCSPYFRALFTRWSPPEKKVFEIPGLSPDMMQLIIDFAYINSVSVTADNVQDLLLATNQLNVMGIAHACCDFLREHLSPDNCIGIWQFANICLTPELQQEAFRYVVDHFEEVVSSEEFQQLSQQELADILQRDDLNVRKESAVYEAVLHWINHAPEERKRHLVLLLSKVRLALTSIEFIRMTVMSNKLVSSNPECMQIAEEAFQIKCCTIINSPSVSRISNPLARPRLPNSILLAIGGWNGDPINGFEVYDIRTDCWINITDDLEGPRAYLGTAFLNGYVYCIGGVNRVYLNSVRRFHLSTHTWHEASPMYYRRCYVSVAVLNGYIYAMGGCDGHARLRSAERYRPETNQWSLIAPMNEQRINASSTTLHNKIYICGGFNGREYLHTCECYSPETDQWTMIAPMNSQRSGTGVIAYADQVFAVGGFDGNSHLCSAEAYNPQTNTWHMVSSMMATRSNFGIEVIDELLFVVGGYNGHTTTSSVEYYDGNTNEWSEACDMEIDRSALSCCVVSGIPNLGEYVVSRDALPFIDLENRLMDVGESNTPELFQHSPELYHHPLGQYFKL